MEFAKIGFLTLFTFATLITSVSQARVKMRTHVPRESSYELKLKPIAGITSSWIRTDDDRAMDPTTGFMGGALVSLSKGKAMFTIETGLLYSQMGAHGANKSPLRFKLDYLLVPFLGSVDFSPETEGGFFLKAGAAPAFLVSSELENTELNVTVDLQSSPLKAETFDIIGMGGFGYSIPLADSNAIILEGLLLRGFQNVLAFDSQNFNSGWQFNIGYSYSL